MEVVLVGEALDVDRQRRGVGRHELLQLLALGEKADAGAGLLVQVNLCGREMFGLQ